MHKRMGDVHPADALRGLRGSHLQGRTVALGVDAVRGAPGAVRVARELLRLGAEVQPLATPDALGWVPADALEYATGRAPLVWPTAASYDAVLLAPAGAALVQKLALGLPDTAPAAAALAHLGRAPVLVAPAPGVDASPAEAAGARAALGGFDAHGEPRPEALAARVAGLLSASRLRDRAVLLVAGGASEAFDEMRVVASRGDAALARALRLELERRGATVHALLGPWAQPHRPHEKAYESLRDLALMASLVGPHDLALVEESLPSLAPVRHAGKLPSGQEGLALELHHAFRVEDALRAARTMLPYRSDPARSVAAQAARLADAAEGSL